MTNNPVPPRVLLPVGITTTARPRLEWRSEGQVAWHARVLEGEKLIWESGETPGTDRVLPALPPLPAGPPLSASVRVKTATGWTAWSSPSIFKCEILPAARGEMAVFDLDYTLTLPPARAFAHAHLVSVLQGLVNRQGPRLFVHFVKANPKDAGEGIPNHDVDQFWLDTLRGPEGWLRDVQLTKLENLQALLHHFSGAAKGVVIWDPEVPATSNIASTVAGVDDLLPLNNAPENSDLWELLVDNLKMPVVRDLRGLFTGSGQIPGTTRPTTGSRKCDAYTWALEHYLKPGRCGATHSAYYIDAYWIGKPGLGGAFQNHTLTNHDYFILSRSFFWDLNVWNDEATVDDPNQAKGQDLRTLTEILETTAHLAGGNMIHCGGFTPWAFKYTDSPGAGGSHGPVETEWETVRVLSAYNFYIDADALSLSALANASLLTHMPLPNRYTQVLEATPDELRGEGILQADGKPALRNYVLHYVGDYDSAAWLTNTLPAKWANPRRGTNLLPWAINPNLAMRAPQVFEHLYRTRTASDHFMAGDSGAGYVNPTQLLAPREPGGLPSATLAWEEHCLPWYQRFGIALTGFLINGRAGKITDEAEEMYRRFSPGGIVGQFDPGKPDLRLIDNRMPVFKMRSDLGGEIEEDANRMANHAKANPTEAAFLIYRAIIKDPAYYETLISYNQEKQSKYQWRMCSPHVFTQLARAEVAGDTTGLCSYLFEEIPKQAPAEAQLPVTLAVRNDGWNTWTDKTHRLRGHWIAFGSGARIPAFDAPLPTPAPVAPGECTATNVVAQTPNFSGQYRLVLGVWDQAAARLLGEGVWVDISVT